MDKLVIGLLGAVAGLATAGSAQATTSPAANPAEGVNSVASYAELLDPIPNAVETLKADDAARPMMEGVQQADYDGGYNRGYGGYNRGYRGEYGPGHGYQHHHHHHHRYGDRYGYYHRPGPSYHHHHHHRYERHYRSRNEFIGIPGVGGFVVGR